MKSATYTQFMCVCVLHPRVKEDDVMVEEVSDVD